MGIYINPPDMEKETFLQQHGTLVDPQDYENTEGASQVWADRQLNELPVILIDNGPFTAACVAYKEGELVEFLETPGDNRPMVIYMVGIDDIARTCDGGGAALVNWMRRAGTEFEGLESFIL